MKYTRRIYFLLAFLFLANTFFAQRNIKTDWNADWIGLPDIAQPNTFYKFRYNVLLNEQPSICIANIATDSKYWLYINEKLVVFEGQLKRGPTPNDTYYDEVNIQPYLKKGNNTIAILVWYWGKDGFCHKSSGNMGLLFEAVLPTNVITSGNDWKLVQHLAYQNSTGSQPNFRLPEFNIHYDARLDNEDWIKTNYNDATWSNATILGKAGAAPWNALWKRPIPLWYDGGLKEYTSKKEQLELPQKGKASYILELPKNTSVTPYLKVKAKKGQVIEIQTDNYNGGGSPNIRTVYVCKDGVQEFESPAFFNGHHVIYTMPPDVEVVDLKYRETKYNTEHVGKFESNDTFLNTLWQKSATTLNVNMRDAIQDSPDRERAQWWGDVAIMLEEIFYSCDSNGTKAIQKAMSNLVEWQRRDSVLYSPIPAGNWDKELPAQMLAAIGKYGFGKYVAYSGDTAMIRYVYPAMKKYMALWKLDNNGLVQHRKGDWDWHDWGEKVDEKMLDNIWYYMALETMSYFAKHLKFNNEAEDYNKQMKSIATNFNTAFWKGNYFASNGYKFIADDRANGLAVCAGLVSKEQWIKMRPMLDTTYYAGPYLEKYILEAYFIMEDGDAGIQRMKNRYKQMVESKLTTLWEGWEIGSATYGGGTYNHGWTGGPLSLMSGYIAGMQNTGIGFDSYIIKPIPSGLSNVKATMATLRGTLSMQLMETHLATILQVQTIDANGIIAVPKRRAKVKIKFSNKTHQNSLKKINEDDNYVYFRCVAKGNFTVALQY